MTQRNVLGAQIRQAILSVPTCLLLLGRSKDSSRWRALLPFCVILNRLGRLSAGIELERSWRVFPDVLTGDAMLSWTWKALRILGRGIAGTHIFDNGDTLSLAICVSTTTSTG